MKGGVDIPAFVGGINISSIGASGVFNIGDVYSISPWSSSKAFAGAGSFISGEGVTIQNEYSVTNTYDLDITDQNMISFM